MIRALAFRTGIVAPVKYPRSAISIPFSSRRKRHRHDFITPASEPLQDNAQTAAILHGKIKKGGSSGPISNSTQQPNSRAQPGKENHGQGFGNPTSTQELQSQQLQGQNHNHQEVHLQHGSKRKAVEDLNQRRSQRPRLKDEAYVRGTMHLPTSNDYPKLGSNFFKNTKASVINRTQGLAKLHSDFKDLADNISECTLHFTSAVRNEVVTGEGRTRKAAEITAYLCLVAKFHEAGVLAEILDRKSGLNQINQQSLKRIEAEEQDAIADIYNYAARFDGVPQIQTQWISRTTRGRKKMILCINVALDEQGILVTGEGNDLKTAEIKAGSLFKREAEKYHAARGSEAIIIKDSGALTTDNAPKFFEFYKILRPGIKIDVEAQTSTLDQRHGRQPVPHRFQVKINGEPVGEPVEMRNKKKAEEAAFLTASIAIKNQEPGLYPRFVRALKSGNGQILKPVAPLDMNVDEDCSLVMRETLLGARKAGLPDEVDDTMSDTKTSEDTRGGYRRQISPSEIERRNTILQQNLSSYLQDVTLVNLRKKKAELPMNQHGAKVLDLVNNNVYSIVVGATGSGKTTQVPQILLEEAIAKGQGANCNIVCTQPRRIAAISVARRVAVEKAERLQDSVGYQVRFDAKLPQVGGSITYCTTGVLLQQLQHHPDEVMDCNSHLVIDEVHERDMQIDFLLIILKKTVMRRKAQGKTVPRIVLMSATMDTELFASYFKEDVAGQDAMDCPSLSVPGRTFPVKERYLNDIVTEIKSQSPPNQLQAMSIDKDSRDFLEVEDRFGRDNPTLDSSLSFQEGASASTDQVAVIDWKHERKISAEDGAVSLANDKEDGLVPFGLVACTIAHIAKTSQEGAILVFLPGLAEITKVNDTLMQNYFGLEFKDQTKFKIFMLHSSIAASQNTVFEPTPEGCRKIILATNIAETSVTIPDVQYVVDTGKLRQKEYDQTRRISQLSCTWISKSNAKQRAGRAGRVQNGNYYALYTKERYESLRAIGLPELLRVDLQEICLNIKAQAFKTPIRDFLAEAIEPPPPKSVDASVVNLEALDALTEDEEITPLGRLLASLPVHPSLGKMIVLGIIFRCLDPMLILGAASAERSLFIQPLGERVAAQRCKESFVEGSGSDHIALLNAVRELRRLRDTQGENAMRGFASRNFLHFNAFKTIDATAQQISDILVETGLIPQTGRNRVNLQFGDPASNGNSHKVPLIKALALAGVHPNLAVNIGGKVFRTPGEKGVIIHPSSVNSTRDNSRSTTLPKYNSLFSYSNMSRSSDGTSMFLRDTTESTPLMATLFGGKLKRNEERSNILELDNWLPFYVSSPDRRAAKTILEFRKALERLLATAFRNLGKLSFSRRRNDEGVDDGEGRRSSFLADQRFREIFAGGLVEVLDRDVSVSERTAKRGWGAGLDSFTRGSLGSERGDVRGKGGERSRGSMESERGDVRGDGGEKGRGSKGSERGDVRGKRGGKLAPLQGLFDDLMRF